MYVKVLFLHPLLDAMSSFDIFTRGRSFGKVLSFSSAILATFQGLALFDISLLLCSGYIMPASENPPWHGMRGMKRIQAEFKVYLVGLLTDPAFRRSCC